MAQRYQIVSTADSTTPLDSQTLAEFLVKDGQLLLRLVDLVEQAQTAIDEVIDVMGRATIEAIHQMSAQELAGPKQQGKATPRDVVYHGSQTGRVALKERQLRVNMPRLRKKQVSAGETGEVEVPAYAALQKNARVADRMLEILMAGVSTRKYEQVLPEMTVSSWTWRSASGISAARRDATAASPGPASSRCCARTTPHSEWHADVRLQSELAQDAE